MKLVMEAPVKIANGRNATIVHDEEGRAHLFYEADKLMWAHTEVPLGVWDNNVRFINAIPIAPDDDVSNLHVHYLPEGKMWFTWKNGNTHRFAVHEDDGPQHELTSPYRLYYAVDTEKLYMNISETWQFIGSPNIANLVGYEALLDYIASQGVPAEVLNDIAHLKTGYQDLLDRLDTLERIVQNLDPGGGSATIITDSFTDPFTRIAAFTHSDIPWMWQDVPGYETHGAYGPLNKGMNNSTSSFEVVVQASEVSFVRFKYKVSTEAGYDIFTFYVDGESVLTASGLGEWETFSYVLEPGERRLKWEYTKDRSGSSGLDMPLIDELQIAGAILPPPTGPEVVIKNIQEVFDPDNPVLKQSHGAYGWEYYEYQGERCIRSTNQGKANSESWVEFEPVELLTGTISVEYISDGEGSYDTLEIYLNGSLVLTAGKKTSWTVWETSVSPGTYTLRLRYKKDGSRDAGTDTAYVRKVTFDGFSRP